MIPFGSCQRLKLQAAGRLSQTDKLPTPLCQCSVCHWCPECWLLLGWRSAAFALACTRTRDTVHALCLASGVVRGHARARPGTWSSMSVLRSVSCGVWLWVSFRLFGSDTRSTLLRTTPSAAPAQPRARQRNAQRRVSRGGVRSPCGPTILGYPRWIPPLWGGYQRRSSDFVFGLRSSPT